MTARHDNPGKLVQRLLWFVALWLGGVAAVTLVSLFSRMTADWIDFSRLEPIYAAVMAGTLCGTGLLMLFRHRIWRRK